MASRLRPPVTLVGTAALGLAGAAGAQQGAPVVIQRAETTRVVIDPDAPLGSTRPPMGATTWDVLQLPAAGTPVFCERQPADASAAPAYQRLLPYLFGIGTPVIDAPGLFDGVPPTERIVSVAYDSAGVPQILMSMRHHDYWGTLGVMVHFSPNGGPPAGRVDEVAVDSAAVAAAMRSGDRSRVEAAARPVRTTNRQALPHELRRARTLADWLWPRRCTNVAAPGS